MTPYEDLRIRLIESPKTWLVTGVAGFIGSNLLEALLKLGQRVVGLDNFSTGLRRNIDEVRFLVTPEQWSNFQLLEGDIRNLSDCRRACEGVDFVLHQAALGSVPRSLADPITTNENNIGGFLNIIIAARDHGVSSFTYAASSSTYGDHPDLPRVEDRVGKPLSPYAVTKIVNEFYADVFSRSYGFHTVGLRYFNVFGPRQNPDGAYAAVIPKWTASLLRGEPVFINGDGQTSRDFCFVANAVQANILAALTQDRDARNQVYNVAVGERITLNDLFGALRDGLLSIITDTGLRSKIVQATPVYRDFRTGDVRHSLADVSKAGRMLGYKPSHRFEQGIRVALSWYVRNMQH